MAVEIREPDLSSYELLVRLRMDRLPRVRRAQAEWRFVHAEEMAFRAPGGVRRRALVGWGNALRGRWFPPGIALLNVTVARAHERRGVGGALYRALLATLPGDTETIGLAVDDSEPDSLAIARRHGFEVTQHGIESELELVDLPVPSAGPGVTFEDVSSLEFPDDEEAVQAMLRDSQTNPEAAEGFLSTLDTFRGIAAKVEREIAALARVDGRPAGIIVGEIAERRARHRLHRRGPRVPRSRSRVPAQAVRPPARRGGRCHRLPHHERGEQRRHPAHQRQAGLPGRRRRLPDARSPRAPLLSEDRHVQISTPDPSMYDAMLDLQLARMHRWERAASTGLFLLDDVWDYRNFRAAYVDGELAGWGFTARPIVFPPDWAILAVVVASAYEGEGLGRALRAELTATLPDTAATLVALVDDLDERSLAVAKRWGYEVQQHGIRSQLDLVDLPEPEPTADVTIEDVTGLEFLDEDAVDAMLVDSQTNPEAVDSGILSRLADVRVEQAELDHPFAVLARVEGVPAAIITGEIKDAILLIHYTGVGQAFRGRNLGLVLKQAAHLQAAAAGATRSYTTNEASNAGIRHINAKLGYQVVAGDYRVRRVR